LGERTKGFVGGNCDTCNLPSLITPVTPSCNFRGIAGTVVPCDIVDDRVGAQGINGSVPHAFRWKLQR